LHLFLPNELLGALDIDRAPNASTPPRREPNLVTDFVNTLPDPVNPTKTKRSIDGFWPRDARLSRILFVEADPKLSRSRVILLQPAAEIRGLSEKFRLQPICCL
jgi:hypothetical protein